MNDKRNFMVLEYAEGMKEIRLADPAKHIASFSCKTTPDDPYLHVEVDISREFITHADNCCIVDLSRYLAKNIISKGNEPKQEVE